MNGQGPQPVQQKTICHPPPPLLLLLPLSEKPSVATAASLVEWAIASAPWCTTDSFVSSFREHRGVLQVVGPADPTGEGPSGGRGLGPVQLAGPADPSDQVQGLAGWAGGPYRGAQAPGF